jgi:hypothetical protein
VAVGYVNGDALLAFRLESVCQLAVVNFTVRHKAAVINFVERNRVGLYEQSPEDSRFTVIDGTADNNPEEGIRH